MSVAEATEEMRTALEGFREWFAGTRKMHDRFKDDPKFAEECMTGGTEFRRLADQLETLLSEAFG